MSDRRQKHDIEFNVKRIENHIHILRDISAGKKLLPVDDKSLKKINNLRMVWDIFRNLLVSHLAIAKSLDLPKHPLSSLNRNSQSTQDITAKRTAYSQKQSKNIQLLQQVRDKTTSNLKLIVKTLQLQAIAKLTDEEKNTLKNCIKTQKEIADQHVVTLEVGEERDKRYVQQAEHNDKQKMLLAIGVG